MSERWLLYDAGCSVCAALAREVEALSGGRLRVRNLRDPEVRALLDRARPGWRWTPMILEIEGERVRVWAGLSMRARLVQVLGPVRALQVAQAVARMGGPVLGVDWGRRRFLEQSLRFFFAGVLLPSLIRPLSFLTSKSVAGEKWGSFILLPEGAPLPSDLTSYTGFPNPCGVVEPGGTAFRHPSDAIHVDLPDAESLATQGGFSVYRLGKMPPKIQSSQASLIKRGTGQVFGGWVTYQAYDETHHVFYTAISILAQRDFPRPYPLWSSTPVEENGPGVILQKVDYVPGGKGILIKTPSGFVLHWIEHDVLFTLSVDHLEDADPRTIASMLQLVGQ